MRSDSILIDCFSTTDDGQHIDVNIADAEAHGNWNPRWLINDIGIVYLYEDVVLSGEFYKHFWTFIEISFINYFKHNYLYNLERIRPICLPINEEFKGRSFIDSNAFLVGYGLTKEDGKASKVPMQVQVPILENKVCKDSYFRINATVFQKDSQFDDRIICDGYMKGGKGSCPGDSGGPMMLPIAGAKGTFPYYQIGIISYSKGCGRKNTPEVNIIIIIRHL